LSLDHAHRGRVCGPGDSAPDRTNNILSVRVGEGYGRGQRAALYQKIQSSSFGNLDRLKTGQSKVHQIKPESLVDNIGIALQETVLFSGTVRKNIRNGRPDAEDDEVILAAKAAQAHDFIMALPDQSETHIEQRGANLSGGQIQHTAIARALPVKPKILILRSGSLVYRK
jgi:ATP-binding cassette subfamily B multidrug efflux pump